MADSTLTLDQSDPDITKMLEGCDDGEHVEFTVAGELNKAKGTVTLDEVKYTGNEGAEGSAKEEAGESPDEEAKERAAGDAAEAKGKKMAPAITLLMHSMPAPKGK